MSKVSRLYQFGVESYRNEQGQLHSPTNDTPARVSANRVGQPLHEFYRNGALHRDEDKPSFVGTVGSDVKPLLVAGWFKNGQAHREGDKPSAFEHNLNEDILTVTYSKNGVLDRDPKLGPASFVVKLDRVNDPLVMSALFFQAGRQVQVDHPKLKVVYRDDLGFESAPIDVQIDNPVSVAASLKRIELPKIEETPTMLEPIVVAKEEIKSLAEVNEADLVVESPKAKIEKALKAPKEKKEPRPSPSKSKNQK